MMNNLARTTGRRGRALLAYFGEVLDRPCGHRDNCHEGLSYEAAHQGEGPYLFDGVGYRVLSVPVVAERWLLTAAEATSRATRDR